MKILLLLFIKIIVAIIEFAMLMLYCFVFFFKQFFSLALRPIQDLSLLYQGSLLIPIQGLSCSSELHPILAGHLPNATVNEAVVYLAFDDLWGVHTEPARVLYPHRFDHAPTDEYALL